MFWPDRWLIAEGIQEHPEKIEHNSDAWIPFSVGPSNCVGKNVAMQEMRLLCYHLIQRLEFRFADGFDPHEYERNFADRFVVTLGRLPVVVKCRN